MARGILGVVDREGIQRCAPPPLRKVRGSFVVEESPPVLERNLVSMGKKRADGFKIRRSRFLGKDSFEGLPFFAHLRLRVTYSIASFPCYFFPILS